MFLFTNKPSDVNTFFWCVTQYVHRRALFPVDNYTTEKEPNRCFVLVCCKKKKRLFCFPDGQTSYWCQRFTSLNYPLIVSPVECTATLPPMAVEGTASCFYNSEREWRLVKYVLLFGVDVPDNQMSLFLHWRLLERNTSSFHFQMS